jgi:glutamyl-tRNA synthetase
MNAEDIRTMPLAQLLPLVKAELRAGKLWREEYEEDEREWFERAVQLMRQHFHTLKDFSGQGRAYFSDDFDFDSAALEKNLYEEVRLRELLPALAGRLEKVEPFTPAASEAALRSFADETGVQAALLMDASRTMLTGQAAGPSTFDIFALIGRERSAGRLRSGVPWFDFAERANGSS